MAVRPRFDPKRSLVAARDFTFMGKTYDTGDAFGPFDPGVVSDRMRARQYEARRVNFGEGTAADAPAADPVQMTGPKGGRYTITAPWLEPEIVRGKVNAEKRLAELRAEGAPLGFIEGGSAVTVEGGEGGWYEVNAPWFDAPEKVQGRELAEARQREIHEAGEPDSHSGFTLTPGENGWYAITKDAAETDPVIALNVQGEEKARAAVATLRAGKMIEGTALPAEWEATVEQTPASDDDETPAEDEEAPAGGTDKQEDTVQKDPNDRAEELGNQPNNSEQAADEQRAGTEGEGKVPAGSDSEGHAVENKDDAGEGGDGTTGTVGP